MKTVKTQQGMSTVEFALVAVVLFTMIFGVIEIARAFFVTSLLDEATRRGARVAVVCPINDPAIFQAAAFNNTLIPDLDAGDITVEYLDDANAVIANPADPVAFRSIEFVRVRVVGYQHQMFIPFVAALIVMPEYATVLPRESLGIPRTGAVVPC